MTMILPMSNGNGGVNLLVLPTGSGEASKPQEFVGRYVTQDGVKLTLTYQTPDKDYVDALEHQLITDMNWTEDTAEQPETLASKIGMSIFVAIILPLIGGFIVFLAIMLIHMAGFIGFREVTEYVQFICRVGLFGAPILALGLMIVAVLTHKEPA